MAEYSFEYVIIGAGLAGASAAEGIREIDREGSIILVGAECYNPYDRPPLSKDLWTAGMPLDEIFVNGQEFYDRNNILLSLNSRIVALDAQQRAVTDGQGNIYRYKKLLLATGGVPRTLPISGGESEDIFYYRYLDDYLRLREAAKPGASITIVGGGFIGSEMAGSLRTVGLDVTMIFPDRYIASRVFPEPLARHMQDIFLQRGVKVLNEDAPVSFEKRGSRYLTVTRKGRRVESDLLLAGVGIKPATRLAESAGLEVANGISVNAYLETSVPDIYAAGDNTLFPYWITGTKTRVEHWNNGARQGKQAGRNMAGAKEPYLHITGFFTRLFEYEFQCVGEIQAGMRTVSEWQKEYEQGILYFLRDNLLRGVMYLGMPDRMDEGRELIRKGEVPAAAMAQS
jgi:NADPH-dependent 2,4-dienoyl-CoA reductase/sulfur reductase-like enzyme